MGKIRVKTVGDEELEQLEQREARQRSEAKKVLRQAQDETEKKVSENVVEETTEEVTQPEEPKKQKKEKFQKDNKGTVRSKSYNEKAELVDNSKVYPLKEAVALLPKLKRAKFDETVELHFNTTQTGISGSVTLPHGTGKQTRIAIANGSNATALEELIKKIEGGTIDFDVLIATPDAMSKLAKVARVLGPRGLMPNPKNGTVTPKPDDVAKKYEGGQINYKTEAKFPILHVAVGKVSFGEKELVENIKTVISGISTKQIKNATLKSTMSPAIKLDLSAL